MTLPKLMLMEDWRKERFVKPPTRTTVLGWIEDGEIPAVKRGGRWYVEIDKELNQTNDELVDNVLRAG